MCHLVLPSQSIAACERCRCFCGPNCADTVTAGASFVVFVGGAVVSLATSWVLVTRLERVGERLGFSEASLGMVAALAADTPEITASITAIAHHQQTVGAGVVLGSNVFNLGSAAGPGRRRGRGGSICTEESSCSAGGGNNRRGGVSAQRGRAGLGRGRAERRRRGLARLRGAPRRAPEDFGSPAPACDVVELAHHGDHRGRGRARRGDPSPEGNRQ